MIILHRALGWVKPMGGGGLTKMWGWTTLGSCLGPLNLRNAPTLGLYLTLLAKTFVKKGWDLYI